MTTPATPGLRRPMDMGQIINAAMSVYRLHFGELLAIAAVTLPFNAAGAIVSGLIEDEAIATAILIVFSIPAAIVGVIAQAAIARAYADVADGETPEFESTYRRVLTRAIPLILGALFLAAIAAVILAATAGVAALLAVAFRVGFRDVWSLPGLIGLGVFAFLFVRWAFFSQGIVIEGESLTGSFSLSARIVKGRWWRTFGIIAVVGLLSFLPTVAISLAFSSAARAAGGLASAAVGVIVLPFVAGAETLLFFDLQARDRQRMGMVDQELPTS